MRAMLEEDCVGRVWVWDFRRSMTEIRLPTEEMRRVLFEEATSVWSSQEVLKLEIHDFWQKRSPAVAMAHSVSQTLVKP